MNIIFAEAVTLDLVKNEAGQELCHAKVLGSESNKYKLLEEAFKHPSISTFTRLGAYLNTYLDNKRPLIIVTDWSDPTEMVGLRLEADGKTTDYPDLGFLAFPSYWDEEQPLNIHDIFSHELSHLWLHLMGFDFNSSKSNKFHTCTSITDPYMAFSEGFAEHLESYTIELLNEEELPASLKSAFWDDGFDVNSFTSYRDKQLRYHGVHNNRFIYHTAYPYFDNYQTYADLHVAHILSSAFTPEKVKSGSQIMASEGALATIFHQIRQHSLFKNTYQDTEFYGLFGLTSTGISPEDNLYIKIFYALSKVDLGKTTLMTDFIQSYGHCFPDEKEALYQLFLDVTHYTTVYPQAADDFGKQYELGRCGKIELFKEHLIGLRDTKKKLLTEVLEGVRSLDHALWPSLWFQSNAKIPPAPWMRDQLVPYYFDVNTGTEVDFMSIEGLQLSQCEQLVKIRSTQDGFKDLDDFHLVLKRISKDFN